MPKCASSNESLDRTASLADHDALKKLKKRVTNILNDAIDAAPVIDGKQTITD